MLSKNLCGVPVDVLGGCAGKDIVNGNSNQQNITGMNKNPAAQQSHYNPNLTNACIPEDINYVLS